MTSRLTVAGVRLTRATPFAILSVVWVVTMVATPIMMAVLGEPTWPAIISAGVLFQTLAVLAALSEAWGVRRAMSVAAAVAGLALVAEMIGSHTGLPFGQYTYTDRLQPQITGVPVLVPLAWLMMLPAAWAVGARVAGTEHRLRFVGASAAAFTAWDLFLDPQMVAWGFWRWATPGGYFGIPWVNYAGWILVAALITVVIQPRRLPIRPLLFVYGVTWALETIGLLAFWRLTGPGLVGGLVMGGFLYWSLRRPVPA